MVINLAKIRILQNFSYLCRMLNQTKMAPDIEVFKSQLKKFGLKATPQRLAVHNAMIKLGHASADMVAECIEKECKITTASIYNILSNLADLGIYSRRLSANSKMYFDVCTNKHIHLYDIEGNEYKDILDDDLISSIESKLCRKRFRGYKIDGIDIHIICHPTKTTIKKKSNTNS